VAVISAVFDPPEPARVEQAARAIDAAFRASRTGA
jgi:hypothetical protein